MSLTYRDVEEEGFMGDKPNLKLVSQPQDFFRELVTEAMGLQKVEVHPETEFYLVNLLDRFMKTDRLYPRDADGSMREEPLALMLKQALEEPQPRVQGAMFRHIGDVSLYVSGYFQDSLCRKLVDVDYYIDMGGAAYQQVAVRSDEDILRLIYEELAKKFAAFVDVLAAVREKTAPRTEKDLLRVYELWVRTRSERAAKALQEAGIIPNKTIGNDWQ
jgi:glutamine synthetase